MRQGARSDLEPSAKLQKVSESEAATMLKVSPRTVATAKKVLRKAPAELVEAVKSGQTTVSRAASELKPRKPKQVDRLKPEYMHKRFGMFLKHWPSHEQQRKVRAWLLEYLSQ
jgi:hypothetical protein